MFQSLGWGGGSSRATQTSEKPSRLWLPSQNGLLAECPHRHSEMTLRPASPNIWPAGSEISNSPSMRNGPWLRGVILVAIGWMVAWRPRGFSVIPHAGGFIQLGEPLVEVRGANEFPFDAPTSSAPLAAACCLRLRRRTGWLTGPRSACSPGTSRPSGCAGFRRS